MDKHIQIAGFKLTITDQTRLKRHANAGDLQTLFHVGYETSAVKGEHSTRMPSFTLLNRLEELAGVCAAIGAFEENNSEILLYDTENDYNERCSLRLSPVDKRGRCKLIVDIYLDRSEADVDLSIQYKIDQSYLPEIIKQCADACRMLEEQESSQALD
jgi:hypothetical protein